MNKNDVLYLKSPIPTTDQIVQISVIVNYTDNVDSHSRAIDQISISSIAITATRDMGYIINLYRAVFH